MRIFNESKESVDEGNWIAGAIKKPGALHRQLKVRQGRTIPVGKLRAAAKKDGKLGRRARLALTLRKINRRRRHESLPVDQLIDLVVEGYEVAHVTSCALESVNQ